MFAVSYVTLAVGDLDAAVAFYTALSGAPPTRHSEAWAFFSAGAQVLALMDRGALVAETGGSAGAPGAVALSRNVDQDADLEPLLQRALDAGATLTRPLHTKPWGARAAWITDPDGHPWELVYNPRRAG